MSVLEWVWLGCVVFALGCTVTSMVLGELVERKYPLPYDESTLLFADDSLDVRLRRLRKQADVYELRADAYDRASRFALAGIVSAIVSVVAVLLGLVI